MTIKAFIEQYNNIAAEALKDAYFRNSVRIKTYVPYLTKAALADKLIHVTTLHKETGNISVNSAARHLLFCRMIIEQYTDLQPETEGFYEEYDLLNESGVLDRIMQSIPEKEIAEFKMITAMKKDDIMVNRGTAQAFIAQQTERASSILGMTLKPALEKLSALLENMDEKDIDKLGKMMDKAFKRIK